MSHLIDILSCIMEGVFQLKPPFSVIAQEINIVNGDLVLKRKLFYVEIENTHMRTFTTHLEIQVVSALPGLVNMYKEKTFLLLLKLAPLLCSRR